MSAVTSIFTTGPILLPLISNIWKGWQKNNGVGTAIFREKDCILTTGGMGVWRLCGVSEWEWL
jgi:hypothetical protein